MLALRRTAAYDAPGSVFQSIVIGTDGSDTAKKAVQEGAELAQNIGAAVHVVTAAGGEQSPQGPDAVLQEAVAAVQSVGPPAQAHTKAGDPADVIIGTAEELGADLIVVGNKGLTGARRFLLGSVPNKVSHHAPCSVMIVHTT
jgi:nucleotide-binding universal stress UspA family protein